MGIKYSKNGIIKFIEENVAKESPYGKENPKNAKRWEKQLEFQGINLYIKEGGSQFIED